MQGLLVLAGIGGAYYLWDKRRKRQAAARAAQQGAAIPAGIRPGIHTANIGKDVFLSPPSDRQFSHTWIDWQEEEDAPVQSAINAGTVVRVDQPTHIELRFLAPGRFTVRAYFMDEREPKNEEWVFMVYNGNNGGDG